MHDKHVKFLSLRTNFYWAFLGNVVYGVCQWALIVVLTKLGTSELVGQFSLGIAIYTPVFMFTNLQLRVIQVTDAKKEFDFGYYLGLRLFTTAIALLVILIICGIIQYPIDTTLIILAISLTRGIESLSDIFYGVMQFYERMDFIAVSMIIRGSGYLVGMILGIYFFGSLLWAIFFITLFSGLIVFLYDIPHAFKVLKSGSGLSEEKLKAIENIKVAMRPRWSFAKTSTLTKLSLPAGVSSMLKSLTNNIPRYIIERFHGTSQLGIFSAIAYLPMAGMVFVAAMGHSASPKLAKYYANGQKRQFLNLFLKLMGITIILGCLGVIFAWVIGRQLLTILFNQEYAQYPELFVVMMVGALFGYASSLVSVTITATRYLTIHVIMGIVVAATSLLTSYWFVQSYGIIGGAWASIFSYGVELILGLGIIYVALYRLPLSVK